MISSTIYSTLNVPAKPPVASSRSLQWTPDGQLLVLGETMIYILTPEFGLKLDRDAPAPKVNSNIQWSTTVLPLPTTDLFWPEISQEWPAVCIGSMDFSWQAVTYSPTNYSSVGSCLLATLSSNLEVLLWAPKAHAYRGEWIKVQDVSEDLRAHLQLEGNLASTEFVLSSHIHALAWSSQPPTSRTKDASLLALGSAAGFVHFLRLDNGKLRVCKSLQISDGWITELRWTRWKRSGDSATATLACEISKREIRLIHVQLLSSKSEGSKIVVSQSNSSPFGNDRRSITALEWVEPDNEEPILVHCKPGTVHLWREQTNTDWHGLVSFPLSLQPTSNASTHLGQASGISYLAQHDTLVITLIDGSYHAIQNISMAPSIHDEEGAPCYSAEMSRLARAAFMVAEDKEKTIPKDGSEPERLHRNHVAKTTNAMAVDSAGVFLWIHQRIFTESFDYTPDSKIRSMIVTAPLVAPNDYDAYALQEIALCLSRPANLLLEAPVSILRGAYHHIRRKGFLVRNKPELLRMLEPEGTIQVLPFESLHPLEDGVVTGQWKAALREGLSKALFTNEGLCRMRLKLNIVMVACTVLSTDDTFKTLLSSLQRQIHVFSVRFLFEMLRLVPPTAVQDSNREFVLMMLKRAQMALLQEDESAREVQTRWKISAEPTEHCPACRATVEFEDPLLAKCGNGHYWTRCSATSSILSTPDVKSCICCGMKMRVSTRATEAEDAAQGWMCQLVLDATEVCTNCGNKCVKTV